VAARFRFSNLSGDAEQEYFADGMVDDINGLSRNKWLFVIARKFDLHLQGPGVGREAGRRRSWRALRA
jgi:TolB-like protein